MIIVPSHVTFVILQMVGIWDSGHLFLCVVKVYYRDDRVFGLGVWLGYYKCVFVGILCTDGIPRCVFNNLYVSSTCLLTETYGKKTINFVPYILVLCVCWSQELRSETQKWHLCFNTVSGTRLHYIFPTFLVLHLLEK